MDKTRRMNAMEKKEIEMLEKRLSRKADESFWKECREAFIELNDSGELQP